MLDKLKLVLVLLCFSSTLVHANNIGYVDLQSRTSKYYVDYLVNDDFTVETIVESEIKALTEKTARNMKKRRFSHSTSIETFEVLKAYTIKADGTKIDVPENNYQITVNTGNADAKAVFSDRTTITIVFPDLEVNDSIYTKVKTVQTEPMFPNHFSMSQYFWSQKAYDDVKIGFDLPEKMMFKHQVRGMTERTKITNGRKRIELTYALKKPIKVKRSNFSVWDESKEAGYALSTFMDYKSIAKAYGNRALPKAIPTERVRTLAQKIVGDERDTKAKARLLYDWVATKITYAGNCIGVGAVVPHDTDFILDNRMGDCKDHATLLEALYRSVNIKSTQALINSGAIYTLPEIPMVSSVNHVITYLPEWDQFIDSTNSSMPFDRLGLSVSDKPILLVEGFQTGQRTPATRVGDNHQEVDSTMTIQANGSVVGNLRVKTKGKPAIDQRAGWRRATQEQEDQWLEKNFSSQNRIGSANMTKDDPIPLLSEFNYSFEFNRPEFILPKGTGGFYIGPLANTGKSVTSYVSYAKEEIEGFETGCTNGYSIERLVYEFPDGMKILAKPDNFEIDENHLFFKATYELDGNRLMVVREINDQTPGNVCPAELVNRQRQTLIKISENLKAQVIYQH